MIVTSIGHMSLKVYFLTKDHAHSPRTIHEDLAGGGITSQVYSSFMSVRGLDQIGNHPISLMGCGELSNAFACGSLVAHSSGYCSTRVYASFVGDIKH